MSTLAAPARPPEGRAARGTRRHGPVRGALVRLLTLAPVALTITALLLLLTQSPFTAPFVDRTADEARRQLTVALSREVTAEWVAAEMGAALEAGDLDRARLVAGLAERFGREVPPDLAEEYAALEEAETGLWATTRTCARCAADIAECPRLDLLAACGIPVEISPVGDANALRRAGVAWWREEEIDRLDVGLAIVGLGATTLVVASGGSSLTVKAGAGLLRVARRMDTLRPAFVADLSRLSDVGLRPARITPYLLGRAELDEVADMTRVAALGAVAADLGRIVERTSVADAVHLMRHVDGAEDAARVARAADVMGPQTRATFDALGKGRVFRALVRLTDLAIVAAAALYALVLQLALLAAERLGRATLRAFRDIVRGA
ncbi:hypothetical protein [Wenxinia marina]|uniref:Uncharacterized protein n=1 Tax=Wenxinia marina DSM 24838 TaxID=1123501 RepID=A0A0D0Q7V9_9RHOB|nr:hypothetical protein [Wenxinia marina]KIQ70534.1 hypothetical protein Wenmar_00910 [Wenxinia marina DSM 24838]GGL52374.1 hypothetical protein GCM10011392_03420 [Wenxinia marina]